MNWEKGIMTIKIFEKIGNRSQIMIERKRLLQFCLSLFLSFNEILISC